MNKYKLLYLTWLIPVYLLALGLYQVAVYHGIKDTYKNGTSYSAHITKFRMRKIVTQNSAYIILKFTTKEGKTIEQKMGLPIEMASPILELRIVPIRYQKGAFQDIVLMPAYSIQKDLTLTNMAMAFLGVILTIFVALPAHRYANRKLSGEDDQPLIIERID